MTSIPHPNSNDPLSACFTPGRFAILLGVLVFAAYPEVILGQRTFFFRDYGLFGYPLAFHYRECFWRGELPLWNPLSHCGLPFLAQWNTLVLYPGSLFYLLLPLPWSLAMFCLLHQFGAGFGMYYLARRWTHHDWAASVAGVAFAFNGLTLNSLMWPNNIAALGWMPWVVMSTEQAWRQGGKSIPAAILMGAMQMLTGAPEIILFTWLVAGALAATDATGTAAAFFSTARIGLMLRRLTLVALGVGGMCAAQLLPFLQLLIHSQRNTQFGDSSCAMPGTGWANLLVPLFHCFSANQGVFFQYHQWWTSSYYPGIAVLVLALLAFWWQRERRVGLWTLVAGLGLVLALGDAGWLYGWLRRGAPFFGFLRFPIKFVVLTAFALPLLSALALSRLSAAPPSRVPRSLLVGSAALLVLIGMIIGFERLYPMPWDEWEATWRNGMVRALFLVLGVGTLVALVKVPGPSLKGLLALGFLMLLWLDFMTHVPRQNPTIPPAGLEPGLWSSTPKPELGVSRAMTSYDAEARFHLTSTANELNHYLGQRLGLFSNCNLLDNIPKINSFFSLYLREADAVCARIYMPENPDRAKLLDFLGVAYVTTPGKLMDWTYRDTYMPMVTTGQRPWFMDDAAALMSITAPDFDPRRFVFLPPEARSRVSVTNAGGASILACDFSAQRIDIVAKAAEPTMMVIAQSYYPLWRAYLDGRQVSLWRANYAYQAVEMPAGQHRVELRYQDRALAVGAVISALALGLTLAGWIWLPSATGNATSTDHVGPSGHDD